MSFIFKHFLYFLVDPSTEPFATSETAEDQTTTEDDGYVLLPSPPFVFAKGKKGTRKCYSTEFTCADGNCIPVHHTD